MIFNTISQSIPYRKIKIASITTITTFFIIINISRFILSASIFIKIYNITFISLEEVEKLQKNTEIIVDKKTILLSDITFENPTLENNIVTQEVIMKVPPENYYNYQTITYNVKQGEETIYEMLWKALKGGD